MLRSAGRCLLDAAAPAVVALICVAVIAGTVAPFGASPPSSPGITVDESFNVEQGVLLFESLRLYGWSALDPENVREVFQQPEYLSDHPPLGRLWLGLFHAWGRGFADFQTAQHFSFSSARVGSAAAFGLTVLLVGFATSRWYGRIAGFASALAMTLMPRLFGHAHLATLETFVGLTFTATVLGVAGSWAGPKRPSSTAAILTGVLWGLTLLSKIQGVLLPVPIALWALMRWRLGAIRPLLLWGISAAFVFFAFWPWLWSDPFDHARQYLMSTTDRTPLNVWYLGRQYTDKAVPWHYTTVIFLSVVPIGLQLLGLFGLATRETPLRTDARAQLLLACLLFPLILFSLPGVVVYDGARLFLVIFPLWAVFIGRGTHTAVTMLRRRYSRTVVLFISLLFFIPQTYGLLVLRPVYLSYHNLLVGGLRGAEPLGLEINYWGDSLTPEFLQEVAEVVPRGSTIEVFPVLHKFQVETMLDQSPALQARAIQLKAYSSHNSPASRYVMIFRREADLQEFWKHLPEDAQLLVQLDREGVMLAALYELPASGED